MAVQNKDLDKWNPNKFVFEVVPNNEVLTNNTLTFSKAVYAVITSQSPRSSDALPYIEQLLITFDASDCRLEPKHCDENFKKVKERVDEIFDEKEKEFRSSVTVFHYQTKPRNADLIMLYTFP